MRKIVSFLLLASIFVLATFVSADEYDHMYTDSYLNGKTFDYETDTWEGDEWKYENDIYIYGAIDGLFWTNYQRMNSLYPDSSHPKKDDIVEEVRRYYRNNPNKNDRPIVDALLNGCR
ncbi:MAG: hypothetical protein P9M06_06105 [Candidatus Saelkia tenebricola]|nr:hypothetical protein [Candidatus Saelkia tenebricola]